MQKNVVRDLKAIALGVLLSLPLSGCGGLKGAFEPIDLSAKLGRHGRIETATLPIALRPGESGQQSVGQLDYRGGLFIKSPDPRFGGLSGLIVSPDGKRMLAVSDGGAWVTADLIEENGRLAGLRRVSLWPMLDAKGQPMPEKTAEAKAVAAATPEGLDGPLYVAFERDHRIWRYDFGSAGAQARPQAVDIPAEIQNLKALSGIHGLLRLDEGTLFALSEEARDKLGDLRGWLIPVGPAPDKRHGIVFLKADRDFVPADLAALPGGDIYILERSFSPVTGAAMQIRRIKRSAVVPLAVLDGEVIAKLDVRYSIDNMEGLAARQGPHGETLLYVLSNDNFNGLQRTVLLEFAVKGTGTALAAR